MTEKTSGPEKIWVLQTSPEREELICSCCEALGYRLGKAKREEHTDTELIFLLTDPASADPDKIRQCGVLFARLAAIDRRVTRYYLEKVCLVGLAGAFCLGFSVAALRVGLHALFTLLLILGIFGCTVTLYLRPLFTGMGRKKLGGEEPALIAELAALLKRNDEKQIDGGDEA